MYDLERNVDELISTTILLEATAQRRKKIWSVILPKIKTVNSHNAENIRQRVAIQCIYFIEQIYYMRINKY